jgi:hypothetical protein
MAIFKMLDIFTFIFLKETALLVFCLFLHVVILCMIPVSKKNRTEKHKWKHVKYNHVQKKGKKPAKQIPSGI